MRNCAAILLLTLAFASLQTRALGADWPIRPDHSLTPGKTRALTIRTICATSWGTDARFVTAKMKRDVIAAYAFDAQKCPLTTLKGKKVHRVEIDHLVPRALGGADVTENLWPECYEQVNPDKSLQPDGAHKKDRLETELNKRLCKSKSSKDLKHYQNGFETDWLVLYHETYKDE